VPVLKHQAEEGKVRKCVKNLSVQTAVFRYVITCSLVHTRNIAEEYAASFFRVQASIGLPVYIHQHPSISPSIFSDVKHMFVSVCDHTCPSICLKKRKEEKNNKDTEYERSEYFVQRNGGHPSKLAEI